MSAIESYLEILSNAFRYDYEVYTQNPWMYYWVCIPAIFYTAFFFLKWTILTAPIWLPLRLAFSNVLSVTAVTNQRKRDKKVEDE